MTSDFDYKKYSLENLEKWMSDALVSSEATPQEIYDVIKGIVDEEYHYHKHQTGRCYDLLALLNGKGNGHLTCDKDDPSPECKGAWDSFWNQEDQTKVQHWDEIWENNRIESKDKVVKWQLPVEIDSMSGEYFVQFPDDLLEVANLKEGDQVEWVDKGDGSYLLRKI